MVKHFIFLQKFAVLMKSIQPTFINAGISKKKYGLLQKNKGAELDSFLSQNLVYAAAVEAVRRPVPPAMSGLVGCWRR